MKAINYSPNRKKNPSSGLSSRDYAFNSDLDFYQDTSKYSDKFRDDLEDTPIIRVYDLIWRGDLGAFPKYYFDNITKDRKCEQLLCYVYKHLYNFSRYEITSMSHRQFLSDIKLSYVHTSGLFPNYKEIIAKVLDLNVCFLKGRKHLDVKNRRNKLSINMQLKLTKEISNVPNKKNSSKPIIESSYKDSTYKLLGGAKKDKLDLEYLLKNRGISDKYGSIKFLISSSLNNRKLIELRKRYGKGLHLVKLLFPNLSLDEFIYYKKLIDRDI